MRIYIFNLLLIFFFPLIPVFSIAEIIEYNHASNKNDWEVAQVKAFLKTAIDYLPEKIRNELAKIAPIKFEFEKILDNSSQVQDESFYCEKNLEFGGLSIGEYSLVKHKKSFLQRHPILQIDQRLLIEILKGPKLSSRIPCRHATGYRMALASVLHGIAHIYDKQVNLSKNRRFLHLATFSPTKFIDFLSLQTQKNKDRSKSLDPLELVDPKEFFATNLEYFLLDQDYQCRRPAFYEFYAEFLDSRPHSRTPRGCQINNTVNLINSNYEMTSKKLESKNLYRVDYLLASEGTSIESSFGHSMLDLIFCKEGETLSSKCVNNPENHVVISFRANTINNKDKDKNSSSGLLKSLWGQFEHQLKGLGILSNYPSKMYLYTIPAITSEYNNFEYRDLYSIPLKLDEIEKRDLIYRILEISSGYSGSYNILTNNCKSETVDLLRAVVRDPAIEKVNAWTPVGLREEFENAGLVLRTQDDKNLIYSSLHWYLEEAIFNLKNALKEVNLDISKTDIGAFLYNNDFKTPSIAAEFTSRFSPEYRRKFILWIYNQFKVVEKNQTQILSSLFTIEYVTQVYANYDIKITEFYYSELIKNSPEKLKGLHQELTTESEPMQNNIKSIVNELTSEERLNLDVTNSTMRLLRDLISKAAN